MNTKNLKKDAFLATLKIVLWSIPLLLCLILAVLELLPAPMAGLSIAEPFDVATSLIDVNNRTYVSSLTGRLSNPGDDAVTIDALRVTVSDGEVTKDITFDAFTIPARSEKELVEGWTGNLDFDRITRILVTADGEDDVLANVTEKSASNGAALLFLILALPFVLLLIRACKLRYYIYQESKMK